MTPDSAANARLCAWLGIAEVPKGNNQQCRNCAHWRSEHYGIGKADHCTLGYCDCREFVAPRVYPALDTREGFWILWDALVHRCYTIMTSRSEVSRNNMASVWENGGCLSCKTAETPEAALFAAAVALMEREGDLKATASVPT